jgi:hypothetical protein
MIQFSNGFTVKCIGGYGKNSIYDLLIHYYDCIEIEDKDIEPNVVIVLTEKGYGKHKELSLNDLKAKFLLGPQTKEELESLKLCGVSLYTVSMNDVYTMYKHLQFPIYDYINVGLVLGAYKLSMKIKEISIENEVKLLNLKDSYISIEIEKNFSLRYSMINENVRLIYEIGTSEIGILLCMEWIKSLTNQISESLTEYKSVYTIFDIDKEDLEHSSKSKASGPGECPKDLVDFLIPFTILGNLQKGFLIVNSELCSSSQSPESLGHSPGPEAFDFSLYNSLKSIWNSKEYIPRRKKLSEPIPDYQMFREKTEISKIPNFEECIRKPPIFIIDTLSSIKEWIQENITNFPDDKKIFVYVSRKKNLNL